MKSRNLTSDEKKSLMSVQKFANIDETDVNSTNDDYKYYLNMAVGNYIESLMFECESEMNSSTMFRLFSLWSSNTSDMDVLKEIEDNYKRIPTFKFIPVMTQITTHLSTDGMKKLIENIIGEFCLERSGVKAVNFKYGFILCSEMCIRASASCTSKSAGTCKCIQGRGIHPGYDEQNDNIVFTSNRCSRQTITSDERSSATSRHHRSNGTNV